MAFRTQPTHDDSNVLAAPIHVQERERLRYLHSFELLDTEPEEDYDQLTALAAVLCGMPISLITLIDEQRQWFKSRYGAEFTQTPREFSICGHAICGDDDFFEVRDTREDARFSDNPIVKGSPGIRYYGGIVLKDQRNLPLGTLCVVDTVPNRLDGDQQAALRTIARQVMNAIGLRKKHLDWSRVNQELELQYSRLEEFAHSTSHDIKSPLNNIITLSELLDKKSSESLMDPEFSRMLRRIKGSALSIREQVDLLLGSSGHEQKNGPSRESFSLARAVQDLKMLFSEEPNLNLNLHAETEFIHTHKVTFEQILLNLIANAIRYNQSEVVVVDIEACASERFYTISVTDNGRGIPREQQDEIFQLFRHPGETDRLIQRSRGIGLQHVRKWVSQLGGEIYLNSPVSESGGSRFVFSISREEEPSCR